MLYAFLSKDKKKICCRPSKSGMSNKITFICISESWKRELFGDNWSVKISDLNDYQKSNSEIRKLLRLIPDNLPNTKPREAIILKPEFVDTRFCDNCGIPLNDSGTCPICDDGEEDYY